jgi:hypothetical protein
MTNYSCCDGTLRFEKDTLMFSRAGIALGLILRPMYQYNPKGNGTWDRLPADIEHGQKKDMCYYDGHGWKYLGTYERLGDPFLLSPANNKKISSQVHFYRFETSMAEMIIRELKRLLSRPSYSATLFRLRRCGWWRTCIGKDCFKSK